MRGPEQKFWASLRRPMMRAGGLKFKRVENKLSKDIPDVAFAIRDGHCGWIELKACRTFDLKGRADLRHFTDGQRVFMRDWGSMSGAVWLFVKVSSFIFAIPHHKGWDIPARPTFEDLKRASLMHWGIQPEPEDLKFVLQKTVFER